MLEKDLESHKAENDTADELGLGLVFCAENAADLNAESREAEGDNADRKNRRYDVNAGNDGKGYADRKGVDAGGNRHGEHGLESKGGIGRTAIALAGLLYHICTDKRKERKGYPMIKGLYIFCKQRSEQETDERHKSLESTEPRAGDRHVLRTNLIKRKSLAYRDGKGVHR